MVWVVSRENNKDVIGDYKFCGCYRIFYIFWGFVFGSVWAGEVRVLVFFYFSFTLGEFFLLEDGDLEVEGLGSIFYKICKGSGLFNW